MEKSLFERMGGTYEMEGDYRLPCLALPAEEKSAGVWGQRHLGTSGGTARPSTRPSGWAAVKDYAQRQGITERLKAENQMEWAGRMNNCKAQAEEVILSELIYV